MVIFHNSVIVTIGELWPRVENDMFNSQILKDVLYFSLNGVRNIFLKLNYKLFHINYTTITIFLYFQNFLKALKC